MGRSPDKVKAFECDRNQAGGSGPLAADFMQTDMR